jgi:hypothetical protein
MSYCIRFNSIFVRFWLVQSIAPGEYFPASAPEYGAAGGFSGQQMGGAGTTAGCMACPLPVRTPCPSSIVHACEKLLILGLGGSLMLSADSVFRLVRRRSIANHRRVHPTTTQTHFPPNPKFNFNISFSIINIILYSCIFG